MYRICTICTEFVQIILKFVQNFISNSEHYKPICLLLMINSFASFLSLFLPMANSICYKPKD